MNVERWNSVIDAVVASTNPNQQPRFAVGWADVARVNLHDRVIDYSSTRQVDGCGAPSKLGDSKVTATRFAGVAAGSVSALTTGAAAGTLAATAATAATGIGLLLLPITAIFTQHAMRVADEQKRACEVTLAVNQTIPAIDEAVASGTMSAEQGVGAVRSLAQNVRSIMESIKKDCNLACGFIGYMDAHVAFAEQLYPTIAPLPIVAVPGGQAVTKAVGGLVAQAQQAVGGRTNLLLIAGGGLILLFAARGRAA